MLVRFPDDAAAVATGFPADLGSPPPDWGLYLYEGWQPTWPHRHVAWPDFRVPDDLEDADDAILEASRRAHAGESVHVACHGGIGRTGTILACLAILSGVATGDAVRWVRLHYRPEAVETAEQEAWVLSFGQRHTDRAPKT